MKPPFVRSPYNYDTEEASNASAYTETMPSLTVQSMTEDSDLNVMMKRFGVTGKMPENVRLPSYGDYTDVGDYHSAMAAIRSSEESFMQFPAEIRAQFENNPQYFLQFVENPDNIETVKKWFPKENVNVDSGSVRGNSSPSVSAGSAPGAAAPQRDARNGGAPGNTESASNNR